MNDPNTTIQREKIEKLNKYYNNNKASLERVDRLLTSILNQSTENSDYVISDVDVCEIINAILSNESKKTGVMLDLNMSLKTNTYISGGINDSIFIVCEIVKEVMNIEEKGNSVELVIAEDEQNWYLKVSSDKVGIMPPSKYYLLNRLVVSITNTTISKGDNEIVLAISKS